MRKGAKNKDKAAIDKEVAVNRFGWGGGLVFCGWHIGFVSAYAEIKL